MTDSDDIHAFAAPGGFIFVSRGLFNLASNESELAAVLAHEIAHVQHRHAVKAIKKSRITSVVMKSAAEVLSDDEQKQLMDSFVGSVEDVIGSLLEAGYSKKTEYQADKSAVYILKNVGYNPAALPAILAKLDGDSEAKTGRLMANHPPASERISRLSDIGINASDLSSHEARQTRFNAVTASLAVAPE